MQTLEIEIRNPNGLHLRPLGQFIRTCGKVRADVTIQNLTTGAGPVNAKQMLSEAVEGLVDVLGSPDVVTSIGAVDRANLAKYLTIAKLKLENAIAVVRSSDR